MNQKIGVTIVDTHQLFRECLASALAQQEDLTVIDLAAGPSDAFNKIRVHPPDILLIAINLPDKGAFELMSQLSMQFPQVKIIILGLTETEETILNCIAAGARGYILKETSLRDLIAAIHFVHCGDTICSPRIIYSMFSRVAELARKHQDKELLEFLNLTAREIQILQLVADGLSNKEIAQQLYLSTHTVKNHVHNVLEKLRVHNRSEAVFCAIHKGLLRARP